MKKLVLIFLILSSCSDDKSQPWPLDEPIAASVDSDVDMDDATDTPDAGRIDPNPAELVFLGNWRVDQPDHAGYEATIYRFGELGVLREIESQGFGSGQVPTGRVARCDEFRQGVGFGNCLTWGPECVFGNEWTTTDLQTLVITSTCDDGETRRVALLFEDPSRPQSAPEIIVDGQTNWRHNDFQWAWTQCEDDEDCLTSF